MFYIRIKELRDEKRITQIELAKMLEVSKSTVAMWESNRDRFPTIETLFKLSKLFNVSIDFLLGKEKPQSETLTEKEQTFNICRTAFNV